MAQPMQADLNGDGKKEILTVTQDLELYLLSPQLASRFEQGFAPATVKGTKKIEISTVLKGARAPLSMKAGYIDPPGHDFVHVQRKMVVVVVTRGWVVVCLDHNLNVLWQTSVHDRFPRHSTTKELAIHISHHSVKQGDRGMIVIGGTVSFGAVGGGEQDSVDDDADAVDAELHFEDYNVVHSKSVKGTALHDLTDGSVDLSRNFQLYALEGATGEPRWRNSGLDFRKDLDSLAQETIPQHNYRLDAAALESKRFGEVSCRDYREAIIRNLPHAWGRLSDTQMHEAHFAKHRAARGAGRGGRVEDTSSTQSASTGGPAIAAHLPPNALVAHTEEGLTAVNLFTGQPICTLALAPHSLHTDINGDGVLEHVLAVSDSAHAHKGHHMHDFMNPCMAYVYSGYPPKTPLFNGTVCSSASRAAMTSMLQQQRKGKGGADGGQGRLLMEAPPPVALPAAPAPGASSSAGTIKHQHRANPVFLTSFGDLTMYDPAGGKRWQRRTTATWANADAELASDRVEPTLALLPMRMNSVPTAVLAAGTHSAVIYNSKGEAIDSFELPGSPVAPLVLSDFSGNGLTDIMLVTKDAIYGFQLMKNLGAGMPYATMVGALLIAVVVVFVTQQGPLGTQKTRSTDRID